ncbi:hypothetical protein A2368_02300 [Candidatus Collierbacteria bacterium RIFOXYB1_FULL_49_13]|uniref:Peptidase C60 sortase A and B n=1 Tax=Candidatus Collierbacteria bacterium RIFOXYB1_FULL_49_13 TaxID=1817728 RepID=A0A1F5FIS5_9BACT|nr:MAG: hypothetical protein A2368_02300 [Candidatus Collierbacteria bacterium RIFOXYB1_FULL_49_13]
MTPTVSQRLLALSWDIATRPKLYRQLASNPYSLSALQEMSDRFPGFSTADIITAVLLAEPKAAYDRNFQLLDISQQARQRAQEKAVSANLHRRLAVCHKSHINEFNQLPKEFVFACLSLAVFKTGDFYEIEQNFSQKQRLDARLSIIKLVEALPTVKVRVPVTKIAVVALSLILLACLSGLLTWKTLVIARQQVVIPPVLGVSTAEEVVHPGDPVRLTIPALSIDAAIEPVRFTPEGVMQVPDNPANVGWFKLGPRPGEIGSAVIGGHFDGENGQAGVFTALHQLTVGDSIYVKDSHGITSVFVVRDKQIYDSGYADDVFSRSDAAHLNLITCDGTWDKNNQSYTKRLVIFADLKP